MKSSILRRYLGVLPFERGFRPLGTVFLSGAMVLQSIAVLVQRKSIWLFCGLLAISMVLLWKSFTVMA